MKKKKIIIHVQDPSLLCFASLYLLYKIRILSSYQSNRELSEPPSSFSLSHYLILAAFVPYIREGFKYAGRLLKRGKKKKKKSKKHLRETYIVVDRELYTGGAAHNRWPQSRAKADSALSIRRRRVRARMIGAINAIIYARLRAKGDRGSRRRCYTRDCVSAPADGLCSNFQARLSRRSAWLLLYSPDLHSRFATSLAYSLSLKTCLLCERERESENFVKEHYGIYIGSRITSSRTLYFGVFRC